MIAKYKTFFHRQRGQRGQEGQQIYFSQLRQIKYKQTFVVGVFIVVEKWFGYLNLHWFLTILLQRPKLCFLLRRNQKVFLVLFCDWLWQNVNLTHFLPGFMSDLGSEITTDDAMPSWVVFLSNSWKIIKNMMSKTMICCFENTNLLCYKIYI